MKRKADNGDSDEESPCRKRRKGDALLIPFALDPRGCVVSVQQATRELGPFACHECSDELHVRLGAERRKHFAHNPKSAGSGCTGGIGESQQHKLAKTLITTNLHKWTLGVTCQKCRKTVTRRFPLGAFRGVVECPFGRRFLDVGVLDEKNKCVAAIEIHFKHLIPTVKRLELDKAGVQVIEVEWDDVERAAHSNTWVVNTECICLSCRRRPCYDCLTWTDYWSIVSIDEPPRESKYRQSFSCDACVKNCPGCNKASTRGLLAQYEFCYVCEKGVTNKQEEALHNARVEWFTERLLPQPVVRKCYRPPNSEYVIGQLETGLPCPFALDRSSSSLHQCYLALHVSTEQVTFHCRYPTCAGRRLPCAAKTAINTPAPSPVAFKNERLEVKLTADKSTLNAKAAATDIWIPVTFKGKQVEAKLPAGTLPSSGLVAIRYNATGTEYMAYVGNLAVL